MFARYGLRQFGDNVVTSCIFPYTGDAEEDAKTIQCGDQNYEDFPEWKFGTISGSDDYANWDVFRASVAYDDSDSSKTLATYAIEIGHYFTSYSSQGNAVDCYNGRTVDWKVWEGAAFGSPGKQTFEIPAEDSENYFKKGALKLPSFSLESAENKRLN